MCRPQNSAVRFDLAAQLPQPPADPLGPAMWAAAHLRRLDAKEPAFLVDMAGWTGPLSERQVSWLDALVPRARAERQS